MLLLTWTIGSILVR